VTRGAGASVIAQVMIPIYIEVTGTEIIKCRAGAISTSSAEVGSPFIIRTVIYNDGNVRLRPQININVWDQYRSRIDFSKTLLGDQILPTKSKEIIKEIENTLATGQYWAETYIKECDVSALTTFDIVGKGEIVDSGTLIAIKTNDVAYSKQTMLIMPLFQNSGSRKELAQFKGEIRNLKTNQLVKVLESDKIEVLPGQSIEFTLYFTPEVQGEYLVSGRVVYNNKITYQESSKIIKVIAPESRVNIQIIIIAYLVIGLLILILIGKIRKARKRHRKSGY
jgi:hypothetical protein